MQLNFSKIIEQLKIIQESFNKTDNPGERYALI